MRITSAHDARKGRDPGAGGYAGSGPGVCRTVAYAGGEPSGVWREVVAGARSGNAPATGRFARGCARQRSRGELPATWDRWQFFSARSGPGESGKCVGNSDPACRLERRGRGDRRTGCSHRRSRQEEELALFTVLRKRRSAPWTQIDLGVSAILAAVPCKAEKLPRQTTPRLDRRGRLSLRELGPGRSGYSTAMIAKVATGYWPMAI